MDSTIPTNDLERLTELRSYRVLDTPPETAFDDVTKLAANICLTPISLISLVDARRIWFKSKMGILASQIPRIDGFCSSAILSERLLIVPDARANRRLASHPLVTSDPKLRFYAGAPLITPRGLRVGTLCVVDTRVRHLSTEQTGALECLARTVVIQLELRRAVKDYAEAQQTILELQIQTEAHVREREKQLASTERSLQRLSGQLIVAQDDERRRIARELHDSTGQLLAALSMNIRQMQKESSVANVHKFEECRDLINTASEEIRNLSYLLHPPMMDELGLAASLSLYAEGFEKRSGISIQVEVSPEVGRLDANREITLFRIIQESLGNIHRHSGSATASVRVFCNGTDTILEVRDRGRGLPSVSGGVRTPGVGITSMQERLRMFGGNLQIESSANGTTVRAILPRQSSSGLAVAQTA